MINGEFSLYQKSVMDFIDTITSRRILDLENEWQQKSIKIL